MRPALVALSTSVLCLSWTSAYAGEIEFNVAATQTLVVAGLTVTPELLDFYSHQRAPDRTEETAAVVLKVEGMNCTACVNAVTSAAHRSGIKEIEVGFLGSHYQLGVVVVGGG